MDYDDTTGLVRFYPWAVEHMKVPAELHLPEDIDKSGFTQEDIRRIQKALHATTSAHPNTELSMLLPVDGELRWHRIALRSIWSEDDPPFYLGAVAQATPVEELCDYHREVSRDMLTHAYNRSFFESQLLQLMEADGVLLLDLDHFGAVSGTYGRQAGDIAIRTVWVRSRPVCAAAAMRWCATVMTSSCCCSPISRRISLHSGRRRSAPRSRRSG